MQVRAIEAGIRLVRMKEIRDFEVEMGRETVIYLNSWTFYTYISPFHLGEVEGRYMVDGIKFFVANTFRSGSIGIELTDNILLLT